MKRLLLNALVAVVCLFQYGNILAQCTNAPSSQFPTLPVLLNQDMTSLSITTCAYTGEFSVVTGVQSGRMYTVGSSIATNYITITSADGLSIVAHGPQPFSFVAASSANLRVYRHDDAACAVTATGCRIITMSCSDCVPPSAPANDDCAGAIALSINADYSCAISTGGTTVSATQSTETAPSCSATGINDDVWYSFIASGTAHRVNISGATGATAAAVYTGSCGALTQITGACAATSSGIANINLTSLTIGTTYRVRVYTTVATVGTVANFTICIGTPPPPPANDNCSGAIAFPAIPTTGACVDMMGNTESATQSQAACAGSGADDDVWFSFVAPGPTVLVTLTAISGNADRVHQIFSGSCGALVSVTCSDPETSTTNGLTTGNTYYIRVHTYGTGTSTTFNLCLRTPPPPPANDNCAGAIAFPSIPTTGACVDMMGNTGGATQSQAACAGSGADDDIWFSFVAPGPTILVTLTAISGTSDRVHQIFSGSCGSLVSVTCSDPETSTTNGLVTGNTYYIRVHTYGTGSNTVFNLCLRTPTPPPVNDECINAIPVAVGSSCTFTQYTNAGATGSVGPPAPGCASYLGGDVWFSAVVPPNGQLIFDTNSGVITDGGMAIYAGSCGALSLIECDDDDSANGAMPSINRSGLTPGTTIYIRIWEFSNDNNGTFSLCVWAPAPPCNVPGTPVASNITTNSATLSWSAAAGVTSYRYSVGSGAHTCGTGSSTTAATAVNLTGLLPNTSYTFCVRADECSGGSASSYVSTTFMTPPLPNDGCAGAIPLVCNSTISASTIGATSDSGVGSCGAAGSPGNGVWYSLAGDGSQITLDLCGSAYDTKVHVYSGTCGSLVCVASNDDSGVCGNSRSHLIFNTTPATTYYILVSGFSTSTGAFTMNVGCVCGAPLSFPWTNNAVGAGTTGEGIDNVCGGSIDISSTGYSPSFASDALYFSSQSLCGNQSITVKVQSITNGGFAGIMFRDSVNAGSRFVAIKTQLNPFVHREVRAVPNGVKQIQQLPAPGHTWLRLTRSGNTFTGFTSHNGINWSQAFSVNVALNSCIRVGLFAQGLNPSSTAQAQFSMISGFPDNQIGFANINPSINEGVYGLTVFPNPTSNELNLKIGTEYLGKNITINVLDQMGRVVLHKNINDLQTQQEQINVSNLPGGLYILSLRTEGQAAELQKFIVSGNRP